MLKLIKKIKRREGQMILLAAALVLAGVWFDLTLPDYMTDLTRLINTPGSAIGDIWLTGLKMLGCTVASALLSICVGYLSARSGAGFAHTLRGDLFNHVTDLSPAEMHDFSVASLITRTTNDVTQVQMVITMGLQAMIKAPVMAVWAILKILGKSRELSLVTAGFIAAIACLVAVVIFVVVPRFRLVQKLVDTINGVARENLSGIHVVHAFNAEGYQQEKFEQPNTKLMKTQLFNQRVFAALQPLMGLAMNGLSLTIFWLGAALLNQASMMQRLTLFADIVVFSTYAMYVVMSFMMLIVIFMMLPQAQVSAERINQVLNRKPSVVQGAVSAAKEKGTVEFKNVSFRYPGAQEDTLHDISFRAGKGETVAIIGATGSGKTSLIGLIPRFYDATQGEVLVDGVNVRDYAFDTLYDRLGYITQKAVLFSDTIRGNVLFGESAAAQNDEAVSKALQLAQAEDFVSAHEEGLDYVIAQSGRNVSGGQKQRLSIARALARKPEILIFDDSFSALDYATDARLRHGLAEQLAETTRIIVAQRVSTIRHADRILVLEDGRCVGQGTHEELMASCPVYQEIARSQLSEKELM